MKLCVRISESFVGDVGIDLGSTNIGVTEKHLDTAEVRAV